MQSACQNELKRVKCFDAFDASALRWLVGCATRYGTRRTSKRGYFSVITCKRRSTNSYGRFVSRVGASLRLRLDPAITGSGDCQRTTGSSSTHMHLASQFRGIDTRTAVDLIHCCTYVIARKPAGSYRM